MNNCAFCKEFATQSIQMRTGEHHPDQDQKDKSKVVVIPMCEPHWNKMLEYIKKENHD